MGAHSTGTTNNSPTFGIALGGGGARGLCHAMMLEVLDDLGIRPSIIAGTSIGALIGAIYASGMSGADIQDYVRELFQKRSQFIGRLFSTVNGRGLRHLFQGSALPLSGKHILKSLLPETLPATIEELEIPFLSVATEFFTQEQYVISHGPLLPAITASAALPGILRPIEIDDHFLVDGGFVNPLPFDLLNGKADIIAAIDVSVGPSDPLKRIPALMETIIGSMHIALATIVREKLNVAAPDIFIRPSVGHFRVLDFFEFEDIFAVSRPARDAFKRACEAAITKWESA